MFLFTFKKKQNLLMKQKLIFIRILVFPDPVLVTSLCLVTNVKCFFEQQQQQQQQ